MAATYFPGLKEAPPNAVFFLAKQFQDDPDPRKVNLGIGAYRDESARPWVLPVVKTAEQLLNEDIQKGLVDHEYLPIGGMPQFVNLAAELILGADSSAIREKRVGGVQCISGTGAVRMVAMFLGRFYATKKVYMSDPTWENHQPIFELSGLTTVSHRYFDATTRSLDFAGMLADLQAADEGSVLLLHAAAHNPTGVDPTMEQWCQIADLCKAKRFLPVFDSAYQGFASGDLDHDAAAVREFAARGLSFFICQSFSKNFGLYNERAGTAQFVGHSPEETNIVMSNMKILIRATWSNPPAHGSQVVTKVLSTPALKAQWLQEVKQMAERVKKMRTLLRDALIARGTPGNWDHIVNQIGMFSYTGLTESQVKELQANHIFMLSNGRASMCGLNEKNIPYVADCIHQVVTAPASH